MHENRSAETPQHLDSIQRAVMIAFMRTTVTLDSDVERLLKNDAHARGHSFKVALNEAVRRAFQKKPETGKKRKPFVVKATDLGLRPGIDPARLSELADELEVDAFLEKAKRLQEKKR
jgi:hypothetical protein